MLEFFEDKKWDTNVVLDIEVSDSHQCIAMSSRSNPVFDLIFQRAILFTQATKKIHSAVNGGSHQYLHQPVQKLQLRKKLSQTYLKTLLSSQQVGEASCTTPGRQRHQGQRSTSAACAEVGAPLVWDHTYKKVDWENF